MATDSTSITIAVAGHQVTIDASAELDTVAAKALEFFRATTPAAKNATIGFAPGGGQFETQAPFIHHSRAEVDT